MSRYILISGIFFISFMLAWPMAAYSTHTLGHSPDPVVETTDPSETSTVPPTQSTADMDLQSSGFEDQLSLPPLSDAEMEKLGEDLAKLFERGGLFDFMAAMLTGGDAEQYFSPMPVPPGDQWNFLPDFKPGESVYEVSAPELTETSVDSPALEDPNLSEPQTTPSGASEGSGSTRGDLDLIVQ